MRLLVTITAQILKYNQQYWVDGVYGYDFFNRYLRVFENVRLVTRVKEVEKLDTEKYIRVDGPNLEVFAIPFYRGPWQYARQYFKIKHVLKEAFNCCQCAVFRVPDEISFNLIKICLKKSIPFACEVVSDCWDFFSPKTMSTPLRPYLRIRWHVLQKWACKKANGVSYVTQSYIQKRYPADNKKQNHFQTYYTTANITDEYFGQPKTAFSYFENGLLKLVNVAGMNTFAKGHKEMLECVALLNNQGINTHLTLVGGGVLLDHFVKYAKELNVENNVTFTGNIKNHSTIKTILLENDLFVFPTMTEGLPRSLIEAMAAGLPCIASDVGGIPELLSSEFMFHEISYAVIADKIKWMISTKAMMLKESGNNVQLIRNKYCSSVIQKRRDLFYLKLKGLGE